MESPLIEVGLPLDWDQRLWDNALQQDQDIGSLPVDSSSALYQQAQECTPGVSTSPSTSYGQDEGRQNGAQEQAPQKRRGPGRPRIKNVTNRQQAKIEHLERQIARLREEVAAARRLEGGTQRQVQALEKLCDIRQQRVLHEMEQEGVRSWPGAKYLKSNYMSKGLTGVELFLKDRTFSSMSVAQVQDMYRKLGEQLVELVLRYELAQGQQRQELAAQMQALGDYTVAFKGALTVQFPLVVCLLHPPPPSWTFSDEYEEYWQLMVRLELRDDQMVAALECQDTLEKAIRSTSVDRLRVVTELNALLGNEACPSLGLCHLPGSRQERLMEEVTWQLQANVDETHVQVSNFFTNLMFMILTRIQTARLLAFCWPNFAHVEAILAAVRYHTICAHAAAQNLPPPHASWRTFQLSGLASIPAPSIGQAESTAGRPHVWRACMGSGLESRAGGSVDADGLADSEMQPPCRSCLIQDIERCTFGQGFVAKWMASVRQKGRQLQSIGTDA